MMFPEEELLEPGTEQVGVVHQPLLFPQQRLYWQSGEESEGQLGIKPLEHLKGIQPLEELLDELLNKLPEEELVVMPPKPDDDELEVVSGEFLTQTTGNLLVLLKGAELIGSRNHTVNA